MLLDSDGTLREGALLPDRGGPFMTGVATLEDEERSSKRACELGVVRASGGGVRGEAIIGRDGTGGSLCGGRRLLLGGICRAASCCGASVPTGSFESELGL